jgi:hypothetical protein
MVVGLWLAHRVRPIGLVTQLILTWTLLQLLAVIFLSFDVLFLSPISLGAADRPALRFA